jgi:hypothetical protein
MVSYWAMLEHALGSTSWHVTRPRLSGADVRINQPFLREVEEALDPQIGKVVAPDTVFFRLLVDASVPSFTSLGRIND